MITTPTIFEIFLFRLGPWWTLAACVAFAVWAFALVYFIMYILPNWIDKNKDQ